MKIRLATALNDISAIAALVAPSMDIWKNPEEDPKNDKKSHAYPLMIGHVQLEGGGFDKDFFTKTMSLENHRLLLKFFQEQNMGIYKRCSPANAAALAKE